MARKMVKKTPIETMEGQHVILNNKRGWKWFGNCSGRWINVPKEEISLKAGSTPVSVITVMVNGQYTREFKLKFIWESFYKKPSAELSYETMDELQDNCEKMEIDDEYFLQENRAFEDYTVMDFAISDVIGLSSHTTSLHCREKQKLVPQNILIETELESGRFSELNNEYQIELKFGSSFMSDVLDKLSC